MPLRLLLATAFLAIAACSQSDGTSRRDDAAATDITAEVSAARISEARSAFDELVDAISAELFRESPELATYLGLPEEIMGGPYLGRLADYGPSGRARAREMTEDAAERLRAVDPAPLDTTRRLTRQVIIELAEASLAAGDAAGSYGSPVIGSFRLYPVTQLSGLHIELPNLMQSQQPVTDAGQAAAYVERLSGFGRAFDETIETLRADAEAGAVPPIFVIEKTLDVIERFIEPSPEDNILIQGFEQKLGEAGIDDSRAYLEEATSIVADVVYPAYGRLSAMLEELKPHSSRVAGIGGRLPNGDALYDALIRLTSDSDRSADEIHAIGLAEVQRIQAEMDTILSGQGYDRGTVGERMAEISREERFLYPNTDEGKAQLIEDLNGYVDEIAPLLPEWFGTVPPQPMEVRRVPTFSEASAPGGYYDLPSVDGSRPGIYWINLRDTANNPSWSLKTLTYHEGSPGHHFQLSLSLDQEDIPLLRKLLGSTTAFAEGWALYAEQVAKEMGMYEDDPFGDLGRLQAELFRAVRLVVDTGLHAKGWTREQAIEYMVAMGAADHSDAEVEIERYAVWPGQALGYKSGMLNFLELRARAEAELGDAFDIREFHDVLLLDGGLPMPIVETRVEEWIARKKG
jgi:uncharacterized protein (DUF885 family)